MPSQEVYREPYYQDEIELREIVAIIRKHIWLVIILPLIAALAALTVSKFIIIPEYEASSKVALGTVSHDLYGNVVASKEILLSRDLLSQVYKELDLDTQYRSIDEFAKRVSVEEIRNTRILTIRYQDSDVQRAQAVIENITSQFLDLSGDIYTHRRALLEERLSQLEASYHNAEATYQNSLATLEALEATESTDSETALARARIIDYLAKGETTLMTLSAGIHEVQTALAGMEQTRIIEQPMVGSDCINVRPMLNTAIALVLGGMVALGLAFIREYFEKNPL